MDFEFFNVGRIIVERGGIKRLGELAREHGTRALLVHNARETGQRAQEILSSAGLSVASYVHKGEPTVTTVMQVIDLGRQSDAQVVIGLGGGSAIDCSKAAAAILANGGEPLDYMEVVGRGKKITRPSLPWIAVPTTAGTGAEATRNAVVAAPEQQFKASIRSEHMLPRLALLDAELAVDVRREVTAASGADALCQLIESYTSAKANPISDGLALEGIMRAAKSLQRVYDEPQDVEARENMAIAALLSGITLTNAGLGAVHGFAAPMGGRYPVPHGVVCAALLPHVIRANVRALRQRLPNSPVLARYSIIGPSLTGEGYISADAAIDAAVNYIAELTCYMQIPPLRQYGVKHEDIPQLVAAARKSSSMRYNPIELTEDELAGILEAAI